MSGDVYSVQGHFKGVAGMDSSSFLVLKVSTREIEVVGRNATEQRRGERQAEYVGGEEDIERAEAQRRLKFPS